MTILRLITNIVNDSAIKIIRELGIEGGCNVQFALHPETSEYYLIEVNPRVTPTRSAKLPRESYWTETRARRRFPTESISSRRRTDFLFNAYHLLRAGTGRTESTRVPCLLYLYIFPAVYWLLWFPERKKDRNANGSGGNRGEEPGGNGRKGESEREIGRAHV